MFFPVGAARTEGRRPGGLHVFLRVLEAGRSKMQAPALSESGEDHLLVQRQHLLVGTSHARRDKGPL